MAITSSTRVADIHDTRNSLDSEKVLSDCCEQGVVCYFQLVHCGCPARATFVAVHPHGIKLRISPEENDVLLLPQAMCCVSFTYRTAFCAFLGCLIEVDEPTSTGRDIVASVPQQLTTTNLRQSFRVPVIQDSGLETIVRTEDGKSFSAMVLDIAETGLEMEFATDARPALWVGTSLFVELRFRGEIVQRAAVVRRVAGVCCGLSYRRNPSNADEQRQANRMNGIVRSLQQMWLKSRITSD